MSEKNLKKLKKTGIPMNFVKKVNGVWDHDMWLEFCDTLDKKGYTPIDFDQVGILLEELPKIFDKFYRVKHPKTRKVMGTGLGLAIVKGVVEAHNGTIDVESVPDKGTTFRILLPVITSSE